MKMKVNFTYKNIINNKKDRNMEHYPHDNKNYLEINLYVTLQYLWLSLKQM